MRLMFVDDDRNILNGVRRMLFGQLPGFEVFFFESGLQALEALQKNQFDIVVSDMRMPIMNGVEFLERVRVRSPETVRIILSGHSDEDMILKSVNTAHQFLAKPCDAEMLLASIRRAADISRGYLSESVRNCISGLSSIPSSPALYAAIVEEMGKGEASLQRISGIISHDAGMTAKILQMLNSAFFGLPRHVADVGQAVNLLGLTTMKSLVLSAHIFNFVDSRTARDFPVQQLWQHGIFVSRLAQAIAKSQTSKHEVSDDSFIAGLLHDTGKILLMTNYPGRYRVLLDSCAHDSLSITEAEKNYFGATHAQIGAYLLNLWGLPQEIVTAIALHHQPGESREHRFTALTAVHVANALVWECEVSSERLTPVPGSIDPEYLASVGMLDHLPTWREMAQNMTQEAVS